MLGNNGGDEPPVFFHLKLVARIALHVGAVACAGLLLTLFLITYEEGGRYEEVIVAYSLTARNLGFALLVFGLAIVASAGITTWLISLYSSFRIAGPLYRLSRNLEMEIERGPVAPVPIRKTDQLQREWREFDASVAALRGHYDDMRQALDGHKSPQTGAGDPLTPLHETVARLKEIDRRVRL